MDLHIHPGTLLAAVPDLPDPNFMHAVVLMIQHTEDGAFGLVVNRKSAFTVGELLAEHPLLGSSDFPVHWGGPVGTDTMQVLHRAPDAIPGGTQVCEGLYLGGELDAVARFLVSEPAEARRAVRFVLGYSGWGENQLDHELVSGSWLPASMRVGVLFGDDQEAIWRRVVQSVGGDAQGFENLPPDVRWN